MTNLNALLYLSLLPWAMWLLVALCYYKKHEETGFWWHPLTVILLGWSWPILFVARTVRFVFHIIFDWFDSYITRGHQ